MCVSLSDWVIVLREDANGDKVMTVCGSFRVFLPFCSRDRVVMQYDVSASAIRFVFACVCWAAIPTRGF